MHPVIGIFTCFRKDGGQTVPESYIHAVRQAGGCPVLLPALRPSPSPSWPACCQGFLLPVGNDVPPLLQDEPPRKGIGTVDFSFDVFQIHAAEQVLASGRPVLGICRGMQILNAACGGTLYQDLALRPEPSYLHMQTSLERGDPSHLVETEPGSLLASLLGEKVWTNSFHHQALRKPGQGVRISARSLDGVAEALEFPSHSFALGVQWHPETMLAASPVMGRLFQALVAAAKGNYE